jgi:hypothetical protein
MGIGVYQVLQSLNGGSQDKGRQNPPSKEREQVAARTDRDGDRRGADASDRGNTGTPDDRPSPRKEEPQPRKQDPSPKKEPPHTADPSPPKEDPTPRKEPPRTEDPPRREPPKEDPLPRKEPPPREDPPPKKEPPKEDPTPPREGPDQLSRRELAPILTKLTTGSADDRVKAAENLGVMGKKAVLASRELCEAAVGLSQPVSRAAIIALEKVNPELHGPVFVLLVDGSAANHKTALEKLTEMGEQGKPSEPVLFHQISKCVAQLTGQDRGVAWAQPTLIEVTLLNLNTLLKIAPDDPEVVKETIVLTGIALNSQFAKTRPEFVQKPFRGEGLRILGALAESQPKYHTQIIPCAVAALKEGAELTKFESFNREELINQGIEEMKLAGDALLKCGKDAKPALEKEVTAVVKDLKFHPSAAVRAQAEELQKLIGSK